jgi:hypothetical protein
MRQDQQSRAESEEDQPGIKLNEAPDARVGRERKDYQARLAERG